MDYLMCKKDKMCLVCNSNTTNLFCIHDIRTLHSNTPILRIIIGRFLNCAVKFEAHLPKNALNLKLCSNCLNRINEYDNAYETAERIRSTLTALLTSNTNDNFKALGVNGDGIDNHFVESSPIRIKSELEADFNEEVEHEDILIPANSNDINTPNERLLEVNGERSIKIKPEFKHGTEHGDIFIPNNSNDIKLENLISGNSSKPSIENYKQTTGRPQRNTAKFKTKTNSSNRDTDKQVYKCSHKGCDAVFNTDKEFLLHRKQMGHKKFLVCDICGQRLDGNSRFLAHMAIHNGGDSPFECDICGRKMAQYSGLKRHRRLHTGEKPYQCDDCGKRFAHDTSFRVHISTHRNIRDSTKKCTVCGLILGLNASLKIHMMIHTGEKPYECPVCAKRFNKKYNMRSHTKIHEGVDPAPLKTCKICSRSFPRIGKLKEHLVKVHNLVSPKLDADLNIISSE